VNLLGIDAHGKHFPLEVTVSSWESPKGLLRSAIIRDISQKKALEDKLAHQALHDALTGLPNRMLFHDRVGHTLKRISRTKATIGVLFIDLDNFKYVNDTLGHAAGDELLCKVADLIANCLRSGDTAARLGGDEFAVLVEGGGGLNGAVQAAQRILDALRSPFELGGNRVFVSASIGIATGSAGSDTPEGLLQNADVAMYTAKSKGTDRYVVFEADMLDSVLQRVQVEADLRTAIEKDQFEIYYQPIVDLHTGHISGLEALLRWNHPDHGMLPPGEFIGIAEDTFLIVPIGKWVLETACQQVRGWQNAFPEFEGLCLTVNVATQQFQGDRFVETVTDALASSGLPASTLVLEITESAMLANTEKTIDTLSRLKRIGVKLAIDDFGTGYSSLSYLRQFPVDILKIDKTFIDSVTNGADGSAVARAIVAMGQSLNLRTVAEGIETTEQQMELQKLGCGFGQGYRFSKPLDPERLAQLLTERSERSWITPEFEVVINGQNSYVC
jgi:diguanylate cyclase (GGDEF)-like protein